MVLAEDFDGINGITKFSKLTEFLKGKRQGKILDGINMIERIKLHSENHINLINPIKLQF
jgi:hypothetical protein